MTTVNFELHRAKLTAFNQIPEDITLNYRSSGHV